MYVKIVKSKLKFPDTDPPLSTECRDFIEKLLSKDPAKRLGSGPGGFKDVLSHPFLKELDAQKLQAGELPATYLPQLTNDVFDVSYFEQEWTARTTFEDARYSVAKADLIKTRASMFKRL